MDNEIYKLSIGMREINDSVEAGDITLDDAIDTLDAMEISLRNRCIEVMSWVMNEGSRLDAMQSAYDRLGKRIKAKKAKVKRLEGYTMAGMTSGSIKRVETPEFGFLLTKTAGRLKRPEDIEEKEFAERLVKLHGDRFVKITTETVTTFKYETTLMKKAIADGEDVAGAYLEGGTSLRKY